MQLHFLNQILTKHVQRSLSVDPESGVKFKISRSEEDAKGICLLFKIDDKLHPLFESDEKRPDYLAMYLHGDGCICTIIEMKGTTEKGAKGGIDQITNLARRLKQEFNQHLPPRFQLHIQGILLSPHNSDIPLKSIHQSRASGLMILPLQWQNRAELFKYISSRQEAFARYEHRACRQPRALSPIENLLSNPKVLRPQSKKNRQSRSKQGISHSTGGIRVEYVAPDSQDIVTFVSEPNLRCCKLIVREGMVDTHKALTACLSDCGLLDTKIVVEIV